MESEKKIYYKSGDTTWTMQKDLGQYELWTSEWLCDDGDVAELYIRRSKEGFELNCFSGMPGSTIKIDINDFGILWDKAFGRMKGKLLQDYTYTEQCIELSNWFCNIFCERK